MALEAYARQANNQDILFLAAKIKLRAERKVGGLLIDMKEAGGLSQGGKPDQELYRSNESTSKTRLSDLQITKDQSSIWLASYTQEEIAEATSEPVGTVKRLLGDGQDSLVRSVLGNQTNQTLANHAEPDFTPPIYNIWKQSGWLSRTVKEEKATRNQKIFDLWLASYSTREIADALGCPNKTVHDVITDLCGSVPGNQTAQTLANHAEPDFTPPIYNIWKQQDGKIRVAYFAEFNPYPYFAMTCALLGRRLQGPQHKVLDPPYPLDALSHKGFSIHTDLR